MKRKGRHMAANQNVTRRTCGTMQVHERLLRTVPGYREARDASETHAWRAALLLGMIGRAGSTRIPVVVHVVYKTDEQNISDEQIKSQIEVLSADYRKKNADLSSVPGVFQPVVADVRIEFSLATTDPNGNPTSGITRTQTSVASFSDDDAVKSTATGGADPWPRDTYLNIWVCDLRGACSGMPNFPAALRLPMASSSCIRHSARRVPPGRRSIVGEPRPTRLAIG